jgi:hypothetical protein
LKTNKKKHCPRKRKKWILFEVNGNIVIYKTSVYKPKLLRELYVPVLDVDINQAKIIPSIKKSKSKIEGSIKNPKALTEGFFELGIKIDKKKKNKSASSITAEYKKKKCGISFENNVNLDSKIYIS